MENLVKVKRTIGDKISEGFIDRDSLPCFVMLCKYCGYKEQVVKCRQCERQAGFKTFEGRLRVGRSILLKCNGCDWSIGDYPNEGFTCPKCKSTISGNWCLALNKDSVLVEEANPNTDTDALDWVNAAGCIIVAIVLGGFVLAGFFFLVG